VLDLHLTHLHQSLRDVVVGCAHDRAQRRHVAYDRGPGIAFLGEWPDDDVPLGQYPDARSPVVRVDDGDASDAADPHLLSGLDQRRVAYRFGRACRGRHR
jgi:hypothetical protein